MKKKGFTLIEILAVVILLAIILVFAIPAVLKTLSTAKKKSFITQAQSLYKAAEKTFTINSMNNVYVMCFDEAGDNKLDLTSSNDNLKYYVKLDATTGKVEEIEVQDLSQGLALSVSTPAGSDYAPMNLLASASVIEADPSTRAIKLCEGSYDPTAVASASASASASATASDSEGEEEEPEVATASATASSYEPEPEPTIGATCVDAPYEEEHSGLSATYQGICYLDPTDLYAECDEDSTLSIGNTGCKKFYIFEDTGDSYKMIMWRSTSYASWSSAESSIYDDTYDWIGQPRFITAGEIANIVGYSEWTNTPEEIYYATASTGPKYSFHDFFFGTAADSTYRDYNYYNMPQENKAIQRSYYWLFDHLYMCKFDGCMNDTSNTDTWSTRYYWTSTSVNGTDNEQWVVSEEGRLDHIDQDSSAGIRPVIEVSKSDLEDY